MATARKSTNGMLRREADRRLAVVETKVEGLAESFRQHDVNNRERFSEVHARLNEFGSSLATLTATDNQHTETLKNISDKLDVVISSHNTVKAVPSVLKWIGGTLAGIVGLVAGWQGFQALFN